MLTKNLHHIKSVRIFMILQMHSIIFITKQKFWQRKTKQKKQGYIALLILTKKVLESCIDVLGFEAPERM